MYLFLTFSIFFSLCLFHRSHFGAKGEHGIRSNYATLTVLKSPDPPKILQGDYMVTTEDREIELECVSENGKPAAEVHILYIYISYFIQLYSMKLMRCVRYISND